MVLVQIWGGVKVGKEWHNTHWIAHKLLGKVEYQFMLFSPLY